MVLAIRSIATPLLSVLLAVAGTAGVNTSGTAWANEPPHPTNHQNANAGPRPAPSYQPRAQAPSGPPQSGPAPFNGGRGGGAPAPGGQAWNRPAPIDGARGGPGWHSAPANDGRGHGNGNGNYGYAGNAQPNYARPNYTQPNTVRPGFTRPDNGNGNYAQTEHGRPNYRQPDYRQPEYRQPEYRQPEYRQPNYGQQGYAASRQDYRGNRYDGRRWNNGWRNDRRYDWAGWRSAHGDLFHGSYYYPPYDGYGYARLGIGAALDEAFLDQQYWIDDPAYYHLPPAYGPYRWVRYYNDCLLIDVDTGQVADVLYNVFW